MAVAPIVPRHRRAYAVAREFGLVKIAICELVIRNLPFQWQAQLVLRKHTSRRPTFSHIFSLRTGSELGDAYLAQPFLPCVRPVAMSLAATISGDAIRETFREWNDQRSSIDSELSESLVALEAYQQNLDKWHQQLARERKELQESREQFAHDRELCEKNQSEASAATLAELHAAREKVTALTTLLLTRTEELRTLDQSRSEAQTELELARSRERDIKAALDDHKRSLEHERAQWSEELKNLREAIERQLESPVADESHLAASGGAPSPSPAEVSPSPAPSAVKPATSSAAPSPSENPLLGSIVEQFGKLRQQRAVERQAHSRQR